MKNTHLWDILFMFYYLYKYRYIYNFINISLGTCDFDYIPKSQYLWIIIVKSSSLMFGQRWWISKFRKGQSGVRIYEWVLLKISKWAHHFEVLSEQKWVCWMTRGTCLLKRQKKEKRIEIGPLGPLLKPVDWYSDPKTEPVPPVLLKDTKIIREDIPTTDIFGNFHVSTIFFLFFFFNLI